MTGRVWLPYNQMETSPPPVRVESTEGVHLCLEDGRTLIDGTSSWWTACHGYNHPQIRQAVTEQLNRMPHVMLGGLTHEPVEELALRLAAVLPGDLKNCFFSESGSVSVEVALKMALQYWMNRGQSSRQRFACFRYGYHGDTTGAMSVCDPDEGMHQLFSGILPQHHLLDIPRSEAQFRHLDSFLGSSSSELAGLIIEPLVQAAGGMKFHSPDTLARIVSLCRRHDILVIFDEIATGFGRTGTLFACEQAGVTPDIITLSKALTGGTLPLAVTVATDQIFDGFLSQDADKALMHGPTFSGNPLGVSAALASLDLFANEPRLQQVAAIGARCQTGLASLQGLPGVVDVRVLGAIAVVQLEGAVNMDKMRTRFVELGVWVRPFGDVVYLMPPFVIDEPSLDKLIDAVRQVVAEYSEQKL